MIYQIVDAFKLTSLKHKAVYTFKYLDNLLTNAQPNNKPYSVIIETDGYFLNYGDLHTLLINMSVLGNGDELTTLDIACLIGLSIINKVCKDNANIIRLKDYSILLFTKKSGDMSSGARFTINLIVPSFIDYCTEDDNWGEYKEGEPEKEIILKPLKL